MPCYQLFVCTLFNDATVVEHDNQVGIADGGQAVGNDKGGAPLHDGVHASLDELLRAGVDTTGSLVENEHARVSHGSSCDGQKLTLTL